MFSELLTKIKADNSDFNKKVNESATRAAKFSKKLAGIGVVAGTAIAVTAVAGFTLLLGVINNAAEAIDDMAKRASKFGTSFAGIQKLTFAAKLSGLSVQDLDTGISRLAQSLISAQKEGSNAAVALKKIGLTTKDFAGMSPDQQYIKLVDALGKIGDKSIQTEVALAVFGTKGLKHLQAVRGGIQGAMDDFDKLGASLTDEQVKAVESYNDSLDTLWATFGVFATQLTGTVAPALDLLVKWIQKSVADYGGLGSAAQTAGLYMIDGIILAVKGFQGLLDMIAKVKLGFLETKLAALEFLQTVNTKVFAKFGLDVDTEDRASRIAQTKKDISNTSSSSTDITSKLLSGLQLARDAVVASNQKQEIVITVKPVKGFEVDVARINAVSTAVKTALQVMTAQEAQSTIASGG